MSRITLTDEAQKAMLQFAGAEFNRYKDDREEYRQQCKAADFMYQCFTSGEVESTERALGVASDTAPRAKMSSTLFHRMVKQTASLGTRVVSAETPPWRYEPLPADEIFENPERGLQMAAEMNQLARWNLAKEDFEVKVNDFWFSLRKYGNIPVRATWQKNKRRSARRSKSGTVSYKDVIEEYFSEEILTWESVYADSFVGDMQGQMCVLVRRLATMDDLSKASGDFDPKAWKEFLKDPGKYSWDGITSQEVAKDRDDARQTTQVGQTSTYKYLVTDIYVRAPLDGKVWKEDFGTPPTLLWATTVGNSLQDDAGTMVLSVEKDFDPDDEIPIKMIHALQDDFGRLYHMTPSQVVRSIYSAICTFWDLAIDNGVNINDPHRIVDQATFMENDMTKKIWKSSNPQTAVHEWIPQDITGRTLSLVDGLVGEMLAAFGWDLNSLGQAFGARTSATEAININQQSKIPALNEIRYAVSQWIPWRARKMKSYLQAFASDTHVRAITGGTDAQENHPSGLEGEYDVVTSIVDDFENDIIEANKLKEVVALISQNPAAQRSQTHEIKMGELMRTLFRRMGIKNYSAIVGPRRDGDAQRLANIENEIMAEGTAVQALPDQDHDVHEQIHHRFTVKWAGMEDQHPELLLFKRHDAEHEQLKEAQEAAEAQQRAASQPGAPGPAQTPGGDAQAALGPLIGQGAQ